MTSLFHFLQKIVTFSKRYTLSSGVDLRVSEEVIGQLHLPYLINSQDYDFRLCRNKREGRISSAVSSIE